MKRRAAGRCLLHKSPYRLYRRQIRLLQMFFLLFLDESQKAEQVLWFCTNLIVRGSIKIVCAVLTSLSFCLEIKKIRIYARILNIYPHILPNVMWCFSIPQDIYVVFHYFSLIHLGCPAIQ